MKKIKEIIGVYQKNRDFDELDKNIFIYGLILTAIAVTAIFLTYTYFR